MKLKAGPGGHGGPLTVICLHKRGFCHPVSDTPGRQRRFRSEAALSPRRRARRAAGHLCFQMKLCAWGLLDLGLIHASLFAQPSRPHPRSPSLLGTEWGLAALPGSKEPCPPLSSLSEISQGIPARYHLGHPPTREGSCAQPSVRPSSATLQLCGPRKIP